MGKTSFTFSFKKLPGAAIIAISVIISLYFVELGMLPINFFTFRVWESLIVTKFLSGHFYPNMKISMVETGDLGHNTKYEVKKSVQWETDRYGCRKADSGIKRYEIVIAGDSETVGSALTQEEMLSEVLGRRLKISVYPFTGGDFLSTQRFIDNPPGIVILEVIERDIPKLSCGKPGGVYQGRFPRLKERLRYFRDNHRRIAIALDRICKNNMARYFTERIDRIIKYPVYYLSKKEWLPPITVQSTLDKKMLFYKKVVDEKASGKDFTSEEIERFVGIVTCYAQLCEERGSRFIFLPIPDKENIYYEHLPIKNIEKPKFLKRLILELQGKGIEVVDTQAAFDEAFHQKKRALYHTDDTHWNAAGVTVTADLIEKALKKDYLRKIKK